jgi:hypothetical protein
MLGREPPTILFSSEALQATLLRLQNEWETVQASRDRGAIYQYLAAVFEIVMAWQRRVRPSSALIGPCTCEGTNRSGPFAALILCTSDPEKADYRARSKWSRVLRYVAEYKDLDEPLADFIKRRGGLNECAARFARCLGRGARIPVQLKMP